MNERRTPVPYRLPLQGVAVDACSQRDALAMVADAVNRRAQMTVLAVNPEKVVNARDNPELTRALLSAELLIPDGIGAVLALRAYGHRAERVPGSELMPALCERAAQRGWRVFLLGARPEVCREAAAALQRRWPGLQVAGVRDGYFTAAQQDGVIAEINASGADLLFVALGSPRQELWIATHRHRLRVSLLQGVGGTFDVLAGRVRRAPAIWRRCNLEWLYRLLSDPRRLSRQRALPVFAWRLLRDRLLPAAAQGEDTERRPEQKQPAR